MRIVRGPRPWSIHVFALLFSMQALVLFGFSLLDIDGQLAYLTDRYPQLPLNEDSMIVIICARLTIAAIPVVMVWLLASRIAKWICTTFAAFRIIQFPAFLTLLAEQGAIDFRWLLATITIFVAVGFLFTSEAREWFSNREVDPETFT